MKNKKLKKLPLGVQTFKEIIQEDYLYVDKTEQIYNLIDSGKYFFISRPRRFGKSLLCSVLSEIFSGNSALFKKLYIYDKIKWDKYPVIHISFSKIIYSKSPDIFENSILNQLNLIASRYQIKLEKTLLKPAFEELFIKISEQNKVVIIIDEYDKPIIDFVSQPEKAKQNREILREFYGLMKDMDEYIKFALLTGVSKFSKVSVFSGLNNLTDITTDDRFSNLLGITQNELEQYFDAYISETQNHFSVSRIELLEKIKIWYNGYSWDGKTTLYNPFSLLSFFLKKKFDNYWFITGTPTFLVKTIKEKKVQIEDFENKKAGSDVFESFEIENISPLSLLFQTGYLTIKDTINFDMKTIYTLGYPNYEVKDSFLNNIIINYLNKDSGEIAPIIFDLKTFLEKNQFDDFIQIIRALFAGIPSVLHLSSEAYYHSLFYLILSLMGAKTDLEVLTDKGRVDAVLELKDQIYIIEFKLGSAEKALAQIESKKYYEKYLSRNKKLFLLGVGGFLEKDIHYVIKPLKELHGI